MNELRRARPLIAAIGLVVVMASPAAAFSASPVQQGESSSTTIYLCTSQTPSLFQASPPPGLAVSFSTPASSSSEDCALLWTVTMTIAAAVDITPDTYNFAISSGSLYSDNVAVVVQPQTPPTTTSTTTTTTRPPATTSTTRPPATTTSSTTSTTLPPTTTTSSATTSTSTTTTSTTTPTTTTVPTTVTPTTAAPTTSPPATEPPNQELGAPGAAIDPSNDLPLGVVLPLVAGALVLVGIGALVAARRRRFTPGSKGSFSEKG